MATIQSSIKLTDGMTPALQSISKALNIVLNNFESMQRASGRAIDTKSIQTARSELAKAQVSFNNIETEIKQNTTAQNNFNRSVHNGSNAANALWTKLKSVAGVYLGFQTAKAIVNTADEMTSLQARLDFINDGSQKTVDLQNKIYQSAMRSRAAYLDTADAVVKLSNNAKDAFSNNDETIAFAETLNKMFVVAGVNANEASAAMLQLTQALGSGVLQGDELKSIGEQAPIVLNTIAEHLGVTRGELKKLGSEGKITAASIKSAILGAAGDIEDKFKNMPVTWGQVWVMMKNYALKMTEPILKAIGKITSSERFINFANAVGNAFSGIGRIIGWLFSVVQKLFAFIYDNWAYLEPILIAIGVVYLPVIIAKLWSMVTAIWAAVAGWLVMNWPILLIVAGIALLIYALNQMGVTFGHVTGAAMWCFGAICNGLIHTYLFLCDALEWIVNGCYEAAYWIYDGFYKCVEAIVNFFLEGFHNAKQGMVNFAVSVLECCVSMCKGVDSFVNALANGFIWAINEALSAWNAFVGVLPDSISSFLGLGKAELLSESKSSITAGIQSDLSGAIATAKSELSEYTPFKADRGWDGSYDKYQVDRKWTENDLVDKSAYFDKGQTWGDDKMAQLKNFFSGKNYKDLTGTQELKDLIEKYGAGNVDKYGNLKDGSPLNDLGKAVGGGYGNNPALDKIANTTGDIAKNTADIAASDEDLSYMRDLAEQEAINRYTLTDLKVEMNNNNNISSNMDLDSVVDYLQKKVYEGVLSTAEGVHY